MEALQALKSRLVDNRLEVQREEGEIETLLFFFNQPATELEIKRLPIRTPEDMMHFLKMHNGARLFVHPAYGGNPTPFCR
ncbi:MULTISPECIES: hypothetical protein [unclassified Exiguobacterium]|uniref:hypothetical protein n=1 Tax=unclassified Exiguobacterium TaxID=2644629 RepID=UPI002036C4B9|nr:MULTISPECIES: hypothetical protein [unclassified Exiguobacterium]